MNFPNILDGIVSKEDARHYLKNYMTVQMAESVKNLGQLDTILKMSGLDLEPADLKTVGMLIAKYRKQKGRLDDPDLQKIVSIVTRYRKKDAQEKVKRDAEE